MNPRGKSLSPHSYVYPASTCVWLSVIHLLYPQMQNVSDLQKPLADLSHNIRTFPLKNTIGMYMQTELFVCKFTVNSGDRSILL